MDGRLIKQLILLVILSIACLFLQNQLAHVLRFMLHLHNLLADIIGRLTGRFGYVGVVVQGTFSLVLIPVLFGLIASGFYWLVKHVQLPNMMMIIWLIWTVLLITILAQGSRV